MATLFDGKRRVFTDYIKFDSLSAARVGYAHDHALKHARMRRNDLLDFVGIHVEAGHQDHVFLAIDDAHPSVRTHDANITGLKKTVSCKCRPCIVGATPITLHYLGPAYRDFTRLAKPDRLLISVQNHHLGGRHG